MKILVTGHKGFIGSYLVKALSDHEVIGLDIKDGVQGDVFHAPIVEKIDVVFHLAAQSSVLYSMRAPIADAKANILMTLHLIRAYPKARLIYTASGGASEQESIQSPYGLSKKVGSAYVKLLHSNYVICNLPNVYGEGGSGVIEKFLSSPTITINGNGLQTRNFVHVSDIVRGLVSAMDWPAGEYSLGGTQMQVMALAGFFNKSIVHGPALEGEIIHSDVPNTTPNWFPTVKLHEYLDVQV